MFKDYSVGVGLRHSHVPVFLNAIPKSVQWVEVVTENYLSWENGLQPRSLKTLEKISSLTSVALHGVSMNIGSTDPLDLSYLKRLKKLKTSIQPILISDHLCWTGVNQKNVHDLLPVPFTLKNLKFLADRIQKIQDILGERIAIENVSSYFEYTISDMTEWDFISELSEKADCGILLDINNVYVSSINHNFNAHRFLLALPKHRIAQIHLAGHAKENNYLVDTHGASVCQEVWDLYKWSVQNMGLFSTMIERDSNIPEWNELEKEILQIKKIRMQYERTPTSSRKSSTSHSAQA